MQIIYSHVTARQRTTAEQEGGREEEHIVLQDVKRAGA